MKAAAGGAEWVSDAEKFGSALKLSTLPVSRRAAFRYGSEKNPPIIVLRHQNRFALISSELLQTAGCIFSSSFFFFRIAFEVICRARVYLMLYRTDSKK